MATQIKFYRGASGVSLPETQDGAVFIVASNKKDEYGMFYGDMYVDVENSQRLHITPNSTTISKTTLEWNAIDTTYIPPKGTVCIYGDHQTKVGVDEDNNETVSYLPGIKVGDGNSYLIDLPFLSVVTAEEKSNWNDKVTAYTDLIAGTTNDYNLNLVK